jgi:hypothetical protein
MPRRNSSPRSRSRSRSPERRRRSPNPVADAIADTVAEQLSRFVEQRRRSPSPEQRRSRSRSRSPVRAPGNLTTAEFLARAVLEVDPSATKLAELCASETKDWHRRIRHPWAVETPFFRKMVKSMNGTVVYDMAKHFFFDTVQNMLFPVIPTETPGLEFEFEADAKGWHVSHEVFRSMKPREITPDTSSVPAAIQQCFDIEAMTRWMNDGSNENPALAKSLVETYDVLHRFVESQT